MFIMVTQSGNRRYAQLVDSFRNEEGKPRQRAVCTLGRLEAGGEVDTLIASLQRAVELHQRLLPLMDCALPIAAMPVTSGLFLNFGVPWVLTNWRRFGGVLNQKSMS